MLRVSLIGLVVGSVIAGFVVFRGGLAGFAGLPGFTGLGGPEPVETARFVGGDGSAGEVLVGGSIPLTKEAEELRRLRGEHGDLIKSIPAEPLVAPTVSLTARQRAAGIMVVEHPEGVAVPPAVGRDWFDPDEGLAFYRDEGGDWTKRNVRQGHTHRRLFYYAGYPRGVRNFQDGSILPVIARELAFEAVRVLPLLGEVTPGMVTAFRRGMGWELRNAPGALVNVWSEFEIEVRGETHRYVAGGVMEMNVNVTLDGDEMVEYLEPSGWVGPVVVERMAAE